MEYLKINNIDFNHTQNCVIFKSKINNLLQILKQNNKYEDIIKSLDSIASIKNNFLTIVFFQHYEKWININFDNPYNYNNEINVKNNNTIFSLFNTKTIINETKKQNMLYIIIQWLYFLYLKLIEMYITNLFLIYLKLIKYNIL